MFVPCQVLSGQGQDTLQFSLSGKYLAAVAGVPDRGKRGEIGLSSILWYAKQRSSVRQHCFQNGKANCFNQSTTGGTTTLNNGCITIKITIE